MSEFTRILDRAQDGDAAAAAELLPLVYDELRRLAAHKLAHDPAGHTLQPTALVHEAWLRLVDAPEQRWNGRRHFFMAAAEAMRRILIERARQKSRLKRGSSPERVPLDELELAVHADTEELLVVEEACSSLEPPESGFHGDTEAEQAECAAYWADHIIDLSLEIDELPVQNLATYRVVSPQFPFTAPDPNILGVTGGGPGTAVADGYYVMLAPLSKGVHTTRLRGILHFSIAEGDPFDLELVTDNTFVINVK